jgi:hypothetical protein
MNSAQLNTEALGQLRPIAVIRYPLEIGEKQPENRFII